MTSLISQQVQAQTFQQVITKKKKFLSKAFNNSSVKQRTFQISFQTNNPQNVLLHQFIRVKKQDYLQLFCKVIYKATKKINKNYLIIIVSYFPNIGFYQMKFYIPKTQRKFMTLIHPCDFWGMNPSFFESILPFKLASPYFAEKYTKSKRFTPFNSHFNESENASRLSLFGDNQSNDPLPSNKRIEDVSGIFKEKRLREASFENENPLDSFEKGYYGNRKHFSNLLNFGDDQFNLFEMKIWDLLIENLKIEGSMIKLDSYEREFKELLLSKITQIQDVVLIEIYIKNFSKPINQIFEPLKAFKIRQCSLHSLEITLFFLLTKKNHNDRIILKEVIEQFLENVEEKKNKEQMNLYDLQLLAKYILNQIRKNYSFRLQQQLSQKCSFQVENSHTKKLKITTDKSIESIFNLKHYQLLYRGIFTFFNQQMFAIFYHSASQLFYIYIWNARNALFKVRKLSLSKVERKIPYAQQMIQQHLYLEIGKRIFLGFKNQLMADTYFILNPSQIRRENKKLTQFIDEYKKI